MNSAGAPSSPKACSASVSSAFIGGSFPGQPLQPRCRPPPLKRCRPHSPRLRPRGTDHPGPVIDKDKPKGLVTLQTPDGIAEIKIYKDLFAIYNHTISEVDDDGGKTVLEDSFFEKGTHLLVHGILRGATFLPKVYKSVGYKSILKIQLTPDGHFDRLIEKAE